jgi:hypothetical protein
VGVVLSSLNVLPIKQTHSEIPEKIKFLCPEYANMISVNPLSLDGIQTLIRETVITAFLEYYTTPETAYLWVLDGRDIFYLPVPLFPLFQQKS